MNNFYLFIISSVIIIIIVVIHIVTMFLETPDTIEFKIKFESSIRRKPKKNMIHDEEYLLKRYIRSLEKKRKYDNYDNDKINNNVGMPI
jgi:hypothetical protein